MSLPTTKNWSVIYSDHSGNVYRFWKTKTDPVAQFSYDPVQPETSSSGTYSGGSPRQGNLEAEAITELFLRVRELEAATASHGQERRMGSGLFRIQEGGEAPRRFIIAAGARRKDFDEFVEPYRSS